MSQVIGQLKILHLYFKTVEKKTGSALTLLFAYLHQNLFNIKKHLILVLKKIVPVLFCVPNDTVF